MQKLSHQSLFKYLQRFLVDSNRKSLIDNAGSLSQKDALGVYYGIANELSSLSFGKRDVCLFSAASKKETILIVSAIISLGAIVFLKDPKIEDEKFLSDVEVDIKYKASIYYDGSKWIVEMGGNRHVLSLRQQSLKVVLNKKCSHDQPSIYLPTSGSSGKNKIVAISEYSFLNHVLRQSHTAGDPNGCGYLCLPLCHIFGLEMLSIYFTSGCAVYISNSRNPDHALDIIEKYHCTSIPNVPTFYFMLMDAQKQKPRQIESLKYGVIAGGAYSKEQFAQIENFFNMTLVSTYGLSEGCTTLTDTLSIKEQEKRSSGVGKPFPGVKVVFKDDGNKIKRKTGEICFKGYNLMLGYLKQSGIYLPVDNDGYFHTGDIGLKDEDGIYHIIGRKKDIIIRGGENISPALVEQKIMMIEGIDDACVIGMKDEKYGEVVGCLVASKLDSSIQKWKNVFSEVLSKSEVPVYLAVKKEVPLLPSGKHDKSTVKKLLENEKNNL